MTNDRGKGLEAAVEKILADPKYARKVLEAPEATLQSDFDLDAGEWRAIHWSLQQDVIESIDFTKVKYKFVTQLPKFKGNIDRASAEPTAHARLAR